MSNIARKKQILEQYVKFAHEIKALPSKRTLHHMGLTKDAIEYNFGKLSNLKEEALEKYPSLKKYLPKTKDNVVIKDDVKVIYNILGVNLDNIPKNGNKISKVVSKNANNNTKSTGSR